MHPEKKRDDRIRITVTDRLYVAAFIDVVYEQYQDNETDDVPKVPVFETFEIV